MTHEYYFSKNADINTWEDFLIQEHKGTLKQFYQRMTGYGWKDKFGFNYNGEALYINEHGDKHKGVWFETNDRRIAIFKTN